MLLSDDFLDSDEQVYERARFARRTTQASITTLVLIVVATVTIVGVRVQSLSSYAFVILWLGFNEIQRRTVRRIGETTNIEAASEMARMAPFSTLVSYVIGWMGVSELTLGTGALDAPFADVWNYAISVVVVVAAIATTWRNHDVRLHDWLAALMYFALLIPTRTTSPRTAWWLLSVGRVISVFGMHMTLMSRSELRISSSKLHASNNGETTQALAAVTRIAANNAARKLVQSAWILVVWPPLIPFSVVGIIILNEFVGTSAPRQNTSPPVSRTSTPPPSSLFRPDTIPFDRLDSPSPSSFPLESKDNSSEFQLIEDSSSSFSIEEEEEEEEEEKSGTQQAIEHITSMMRKNALKPRQIDRKRLVLNLV